MLENTFPSPVAGGLNRFQSAVNSFIFADMVEKLASHVRLGHPSNAMEFFELCLSLARGIDYAVANNEVPSKVQDLPSLLKQVCQRKNDLPLLAAIMVLMMSVKNACKIGWFSEKESEELFTLANEIGSSFCSPGDISTGPSDSSSTIKKIMERFYPRMRMGQILASLDIKPGYGAYVIDFHISKNSTQSSQEKIWLFVAQTENIDTSTCIISPPLVSFLLNGNGVDRRTNVLMDTGPQLPTNVTSILKYGTNLLQAVGQFKGHHVIIVAFMSVSSSPDTLVPSDYVQPAVAVVDPDSDIIEGPSRISLHCPISYTRIKTPVKGRSCRHLQCFDFDNFVDINSRRPSWRCPHCNQHVCYEEIRIDQNMVKVLREVGENVDEVIISADGSWKAVLESDGTVDEATVKTPNSQKERTGWQESTSVSNSLPNVLELTEDNNEMGTVNSNETEDRKPLQASLPVATHLNLPPELNRINEANQSVAAEVEDDFWPGIYLSSEPMNSSARSNAQRVGSIFEPVTANLMQSPVLTDAFSPAINQESDFTTPIMQSQGSSNNFQLQQSQYVNSLANNEHVRLPAIPRHVSRTPIAVQALPVQPQAPNPQRRQNHFNPIYSTMESQHHFRGHVSPLQVPDISSLQQALNQRKLQSVGQSSSANRSSSHHPHTLIQQGGAQVGTSHAAGMSSQRQWLAYQAAFQQGRQALSVAVPSQTSRTENSLPVTANGNRGGIWEQRENTGTMSQPRAVSLVDSTSEKNQWPRGRMRGSLSGPAYSAYSQFIIQPTQPAQTARPPTNPTPPANSVTPQQQVSVANSRNAGRPHITSIHR
ncbi:E4 SUMO-protein ligase PIAL2 isoform X2 [Juglans microcarpa x Juglans regia]|uniref:E4 SUMO-protein ligase PIAL2 isoform X2 n=1 Tax=Juglans microcarpa x Juglans regia TaxID=2249226 RepID=UPI001B7E68AD|nr:E4 SUMO-protein ligase PIAL2 isoform X2 [Juglans microcarpa x Juglans regia]